MKIKKLISVSFCCMLLTGCCTVFHICPPPESYFDLQADIAKQLNNAIHATDPAWWSFAPMPAAPYPPGTIVVNGFSWTTNCLFQDADLQTLPDDGLIPHYTIGSGFQFDIHSPTNITTFSAGLDVSSQKSLNVMYSNMVYEAVFPDVYRNVTLSNTFCLNSLKQYSDTNGSPIMIIGYLKAQVYLSSFRDFKFDINAAAYGANGTYIYTNSQGWTVFETNVIPCFAIVTTPKFTPATNDISLLFNNSHIGAAFISSAEGTTSKYNIELRKPDFNEVLQAMKPISQ
jgi:hypothetical protein